MKISAILIILMAGSAAMFGQKIGGHSLVELRTDTSLQVSWADKGLSPIALQEPFPSPNRLRYSILKAPLPGEIPRVYSYHDLGLFCKFEVQIQRATYFPVKVRLGEVQYVEALEGKYGYWSY